MMRKNVIALIGTLLLAVSFLTASVSAHAMPSSSVNLDFYKDRVAAELILPLDRLEIAFGSSLTETPAEVLSMYQTELEAYVVEHVHPVTSEGQEWTVAVSDMSLQLSEEPYDLIVNLSMTPPAGATVQQFTLNYDVIVHQLVTHSALVSIRSDWNHGVFASEAQLIGTIRGTETSLAVDQSGGSWWTGFQDVMSLGMAHIAEGTDHLLFLLVLLLPAPMLAKGRRWAEFGGISHSLLQLLKIVTAFTIGHSVTLIAGALGWVHVSSQIVESLIAFSILVSAVHAFRPLFPGRESLVALVFGLVHGMAFATLIEEIGIDPWRMAASILGFNIGIEIMQLIVIAVTIPWLMMLSVTRVFPAVRILGALLAATASLAWLSERVTGQENPLSKLVNSAAGYAHWLVVLIAVTAVIATIMKYRSALVRKQAQEV
ncbi:hypothetical protein FHS18_003519 [Paenibacillus phyllosphaerae]|uniref:HupE / UreJ protein n=1 Tax=Paenibacillus phyllosphaerae TaxID=274593 RepID=A0A7W5B042_9BACL|nr:HupE/UreJ family protein [Paenibacillus phyllosphaerae]MBB3111451.1 hypothetical protein [Paenibacillus phyllosphaerae]